MNSNAKLASKVEEIRQDFVYYLQEILPPDLHFDIDISLHGSKTYHTRRLALDSKKHLGWRRDSADHCTWVKTSKPHGKTVIYYRTPNQAKKFQNEYGFWPTDIPPQEPETKAGEK